MTAKKKCAKKGTKKDPKCKTIPGTCKITGRGKKTTIECDSAAAKKLLAAAAHQPIPDKKIDALAMKAAKAWKSRHDGTPMDAKGFKAAWKVAFEDLSRFLGVPPTGMALSQSKDRFEEALSMALIEQGSSLDHEGPAFRPREAKKRSEGGQSSLPPSFPPGFPLRRDFGETNEPPMTEGAYGRRAEDGSSVEEEEDLQRFYGRASDGLKSRRRRH